MDKNPLVDLVVSEEDRSEVIEFLDSIYNSFFKNQNRLDLISQNTKFGPALLSILGQNINSSDYTKSIEIITNLINTIKALPTIEIILATNPTEATISEINDFIKNNASEKSVCDIKIDPKILGGAIFMIDGKYIDMSVAGKLDQTFKTNRIQDFLK